MRGPIRRAALLGFCACAVFSVSATAAEVNRDSYREAVEPICKANTEENERIFKGVRAEVVDGKLKRPARQFEKAARALKRAVAELRSVPQPPADEARLARWLDDLSIEVSLLERIAVKLRAGKKRSAQRLVVRLTSRVGHANAIVLPFEFRYCRLGPSRFT